MDVKAKMCAKLQKYIDTFDRNNLEEVIVRRLLAMKNISKEIVTYLEFAIGS